MATYTERLQKEIERVTLKGNADKLTLNNLAGIIWEIDQRLVALENPGVETEVEAPVVEEEVVEEKPSRRVSAKPATK